MTEFNDISTGCSMGTAQQAVRAPTNQRNKKK